MTLIFNLGLMASVMAVIALGIRTCFRRMPKVYTYILWIFVFVRAVLPVSYSSAFSLWTLFQKAPAQAETANLSVQTADTAFLPYFQTSAPQNLPQTVPQETPDAIGKASFDLMAAATAVWALGLFIMLFYSLLLLLKLRRTIRFSVLEQECSKICGFSVYESDQIKTAFILGFFRPSLYLPSGLSASQKHLILEHETSHIRRHDHQIKIAAWLILSLHWFQPLLWISFYFLDKDMELSCDEQVLKNLGTQVRTDYSSLLLKLAAQENFPAGIPLSFCRGGSKTRIKNVVRYRPQKAFSAALTVLLIAVTLYGCMGSPKENLSAPDTKALQTEADFNETQTKASGAAESEELAFAKKFVSAIAEASTNIIADDIYEMLSSELKAEANSLTCSLDIRRLDTGHYMTSYGPFIPGEPVITEESDGIFHYEMKPVNSNPESYRWHGSEDTVWKGTLLVKQNADGGFQIAGWNNIVTDAITRRTKCLEQFQNSVLQIIAESIPSLDEWKQEWQTLKWAYPNDDAEKAFYDAFGDPCAYLENSLTLSGGEVTDVKTDETTQDKQITYTFQDGSVIFHMQHRTADNIWVPYALSDGGYAQK